MPFSMSQASLPVFEIGLNALSGVLDKAAAFTAAKKVDAVTTGETHMFCTHPFPVWNTLGWGMSMAASLCLIRPGNSNWEKF